MTEREEEPRRSKSRSRGPGPARYLYGALLVAIGACVGIVIGSVSDTPRLLLERMRGPVETVDVGAPASVAAPEPEAAPKAAAPLEAFGELQNGKPVADAAPPAAPPVSSPPPPAKPAPVPAKPAAAPKPPAAAATLPPAAPAPASGKSVVQVLSLAERAQADALVTRLKSQGFQPYLVPMPDKSGRFRVRVRPGAGQSVAELEQKLRGLGMKTWITAE